MAGAGKRRFARHANALSSCFVPAAVAFVIAVRVLGPRAGDGPRGHLPSSAPSPAERPCGRPSAAAASTIRDAGAAPTTIARYRRIAAPRPSSAAYPQIGHAFYRPPPPRSNGVDRIGRHNGTGEEKTAGGIAGRGDAGCKRIRGRVSGRHASGASNRSGSPD